MAIDQRDVSSTLRFMDDRALQQYAAMHKNDPYIFPLAFQESQNRQRLRMSQQGAQGMQPQPKVADQALAQMMPQPMPEDVGIGALPAGNMEFAAEGGIMGYEGYDEGPSDFGQGPVMMMAGGGVARYAGEGPSLVRGDFFGQLDQQKADQIAQLNGQLAIIEPQLRAAAASGDQQAIQLYAQQAQALRNQINAVRETTGNRVGTIDKLAAQSQPTALTPEGNRNAINAFEQTARKDPSVYGAPVPAKPKPSPERKETGRKDTERKDTAEKDIDVQSMFRTALEQADAKPNPYETQLKAINQSKVKAAEENVTGLDAIQKQFADIYKGRKERLDTREGEIAKMKDQSLGLALLNAGARMMQTRGSIGEAIGAGIDTGSKQYVAGLDKINAAKDKLADARDRLEEIEAQRGELSARELHKARNEVKSLTTAGMENLIQAAMAERKINRAEAIAFVEQQIKVSEGSKDRASREGIARLQANTANRPGAEMQAVERIMKEKNIPFTEALAIYNNTRREGVSEEKLRGDWLDQAKRLQIAQDYPNVKTFEDYKTVMGMGGGAGDFKVVGVRPAK